MKIYTKTGDDGSTGLFGGCRVNKNHPIVETYGTVDELNSVLGIAQSLKPVDYISTKLQRIQNELFEVGADLSLPWKEKHELVHRIDAPYLDRLEKEIDEMVIALPPLKEFILPGGSQLAASLHHARTVCRRGERACRQAQETDGVNPEIIKYLNRLSDWLFCLARFANHSLKVQDTVWKK
ncbi:MAG: cob(I)yrinic acid a,c-diamide adenosyltransferase [Proteobacteria bacterium]|jgi:cob(I)alamin adenosyltransferase|nr:cob(I)yrinic acid a,c-diamide adenosyltransferase [Pseudomonadota bacterium]